MRSKLLKWNTVSSLINQIVTFVCGFILPRLILLTYGSQVNGLVNSITQFLQVITFLELGVGAVVQSSMYKPLADKNYTAISRIMSSAQKFFGKLATILLIYVAVLMIGYPFVAEQDYGWGYTALLIASISISFFAQYYFGMVDSILIRSDQHGYIQYLVQTITVVLNTLACVVLIRIGAGIHFIKLTTSLIYLLRPLAMRLYVNRNYQIDRKIQYEGEPIRQKWNGVAQHVAASVLDGTDNIVLTVFSTLSNVSVYSVYHMVLYGIKTLLMSMTNGVQSLVGELWAKQELKTLDNTFGWFEWLVHTGTVFIFGCTGMLVMPFVLVYTSGVTDADYAQPLFAALITMAHAGHCLRLPYSVMILAGGHYKQTQSNYIIVAAMNVLISVAAVVSFGLVGVAIGTLISMLYQTVWMAHYVSKNLNQWPFRNFLKQLAVDVLTVVVAAFASHWIRMDAVNYLSWIVMAFKVALVWLAVMIPINLIFYKAYAAKPMEMVKARIQNKKSV